jgi:L-ribulokinase
MKERAFALGLDFGTNSVRALLVDVSDGAELATAVHLYETGKEGILLDPADPNLARQNPADYITGIEAVVRSVLAEARKCDRSFDPGRTIGIGVDTTGSTPLPVDNTGTPLGFQKKFKKNPNAQV